MPREARKSSSTNIYHVVIKGADRQSLFEESKDYKKYLEILKEYKEQCQFELFAYCLMSNHVHLLLKVSSMPLENIFRRINTYYAGWFNAKYSRTGHLQDDRYFSEPVETKEYLWNVIRYIHYNPLNAGLESTLGEQYMWNSYRDYLLNDSKLIDTNSFFQIFGSREDFFLFHQTKPSATYLDVNNLKKRLPDDVAKDIILEISNCNTSTEFQNLPLAERNKYLLSIYKKGVSIRQLNRLTGTPRGVIERTVLKK